VYEILQGARLNYLTCTIWIHHWDLF